MAFNSSRKQMNARGTRALTFPDQEDVILLEYICTDQTRLNITTKTHIIHQEPKSAADCPVKYLNQWDTVDMTYPCPELGMRPIAIYRDPFRQGKHKIVFCELENMSGKPLEYNTRTRCKELLDSIAEEEPWFGFEQEYYFVDENGVPLDYCWKHKIHDIDSSAELGMGNHVALEREIVDTHLQACIYAGLNMYGVSRECTPSEWEYQMGPTTGIAAADELHVSRYILRRVAEMYGVDITFWNPDCLRWADSRSTLHLNFSTKNTRKENGIEYIHEIAKRLENHPQEKLLKYYDLRDGRDAHWRLSGEYFMPNHESFVCKVGDKDLSSIRIPTQVHQDKKGYIEERRASSEADPYDVIRAFVTAALFDQNGL